LDSSSEASTHSDSEAWVDETPTQIITIEEFLTKELKKTNSFY